MSPQASANPGAYPIQLEVDDPAPQSRLSVLLRIVFAIPQLIVVYFVGLALAVVTLVAWFAILITGSYPAGLLKFAIGASAWNNRVIAYIFLLTDKYPPFALEDDTYPVRFLVSDDGTGRNRLTTFFRIILAIPQLIIVGVLRYAALIVLFIAWVAALITGSVPPGLHSFLAGFCRWQARVTGYVTLLCDPYPPFSLS